MRLLGAGMMEWIQAAQRADRRAGHRTFKNWRYGSAMPVSARRTPPDMTASDIFVDFVS
ncbi:hypothetical protein [Cupriavidus neocaledonicus]|uniref:Uncharacterized protein n=1 Tax=Cupriavidus neocaledonicus TaxID=1040979 RepID=A0A375HS84_9BURK|nr:hypothetical protein [Cupriavidus neocaledonicus]SOZ39644.1 hypothetical protein CBM2605_B30067 [Cupriavidus neocaledonicus]SPD61029.1 protein of unknown function [Cupriavidus neocaledonicus]